MFTKRLPSLFPCLLVLTLLASSPAVPAFTQDLATLGRQYNVHYEAGRYREAEAAVRQYLQIAERSSQHQPEVIATALHNLASVCFNQARYAEAEPLFQRSLGMAEKLFGPNHLSRQYPEPVSAHVSRAGAVRRGGAVESAGIEDTRVGSASR